MASNSSFHSTQDEFESLPQVEREAGNGEGEGEGGRGGSKEEIRLLKQALEGVQIKLLESRKENRSLQAQLRPDRDREECEDLREKGREAELMESLAELQAKLTDTQERYHQAVEEAEELRGHLSQGGGEEVLGQSPSTLEQEVKQLKLQLIQSGAEKEKAAQQIRRLEEVLKRVEEERQGGKESEQRGMRIEELYKEAQEEIRMLQVNKGFTNTLESLYPFIFSISLILVVFLLLSFRRL